MCPISCWMNFYYEPSPMLGEALLSARLHAKKASTVSINLSWLKPYCVQILFGRALIMEG